MRERAVFGSSFGMANELDFFMEPRARSMTHRERLATIGTFIVAHELGHALFKLPDFYDHPPECLMTTQLETDCVAGMKLLSEHPGRCPKCEPRIAARQMLARADTTRSEERWGAAIDYLNLAMRRTPKHIDGVYGSYLATLGAEMAELHARGDRVAADRWASAALKIVPTSKRALAVREKLAASSTR